MPEYGQLLHEQQIWEWKPYYLNYDRLKGWINELESSNSDKAARMFHEELELSVERVHQFYVTQERSIQAEVEEVKTGSDGELTSAEDMNHIAKVLDDIQKLRDFAEQNAEGLRKIAKKYDKNVRSLAQVSPEEVCPSLQERVVQLVKELPFSHATQRLKPLQEGLRALQQGEGTKRSLLFRRMSTQALNRRLSGFGLGEPLLMPPKRHDSTRFGLTRGVPGFLKSNLVLMVSTIAVLYLARWNPTPKLTPVSYLVIWVTSIVLTLLVRQNAPDIVLMAATLFLTISGVLTQEDAWAAFSNDVVLSVAGLGVVAHAVESTGVIDLVFGALLGKPQSLPVAMLRLFLPAVVLNVCISNTCVMSCLITVIDKWSSDIGYPKAFFLLPLSYILLISGTFATFTTSTNLIAQGLLKSQGYAGFDTFALAPPCMACTVVAIVYLIVVSPIVLRRFTIRKGSAEETAKQVQIKRRAQNRYDVRIQITGRALRGETLESSGLLGKITGTRDVLAYERYGKIEHRISADLRLELDDVLWLRTNIEGLASLFHRAGVVFLALDLSDEVATFDPGSRVLVEAVLDKDSPLVGHKIGHARKYRPEFDCPIVAYRGFNNNQGDEVESVDSLRSGGHEIGVTPDRRLEAGDHLILNTPTSFYKTYKDSSDFVVLRKVIPDGAESADQFDKSKALAAGLILCGFVALVATSTLQLLEGVFVALAALICTGCTTMDSIVRAVKLRTVLTIVGAFGLGKAIGQEGVATVLADMLIYLLAPFGTQGLLVAIFAATVALGVIFHGTAVVVLMFPVCKSVAMSMDMPIHQLVSVLCIAVACQMLSPISYQTNLMAYSTGGYQFADFTRVGIGLVLCIAVVGIPVCERTFAA
mmetsp:Transcript_105656/g.305725  ORF Transcript_105656/g.305725 Transcript_105656/m.305725 type:complete len:872 (-) Transcript_105656:79-2694(-)